MGELPLLDELAIVAVLGVAVTVILSRLKLPTVAGLLFAGALGGPFGLGLVHSVEAIEVLSEIGVVLLLFTIGLEFSLEKLRNIFRRVAAGAFLQVALTATVVAAIVHASGRPWGQSVFLGFVFSMSSTAIILRALTERRELDAPHGRFIVGTLIFQDLAVVPMVLVVPFLGQISDVSEGALSIGRALVEAAALVVALVGVSRFVVPRVLGWVDASKSREIFLLAIVAICIGTAWLTSQVGLSLALGAFLGGMVVADTEYGHRAMGDILPLRDAFMSIFFVSLGMLFDLHVVLAEPALVVFLLAMFLGLKGVLATLAAMFMRFPSRVAWLAGVGLAQFGEFGFVLCRLGKSSGLVDQATLGPVLAAGIVSMFITPLLVRVAPHIRAGERLLGPLERLLGVRSIEDAETPGQALKEHVVVVGFGVAGRLCADALAAINIPYVGLELNADSVRLAREKGHRVFYADATSEEALGHAHLKQARALVLLMNDPQAAERVVDTARRVAPDVPVLMRTRYLGEKQRLFALGAKDVVAEEVEGAVEMLARLLRWIEVPRNVIEERIRDARLTTQSTDRKQTLPRTSLGEFRALADLKIESLLIRGGTLGTRKSATALQLRRATGALVVAVRRGDKLLEHPDPDALFEPEDVVYLVGTSNAVRVAQELLSTTPD